MKIHEYQAKEVLARHDVPIPQGDVASTPQKARNIAQSVGGKAVVKAQVHAGGRGKAGGVKVVSSLEEAERAAAEILGRNLVTVQTGPEGVPVRKVLVEEVLQIAKELYLGIVVDGQAKGVVIMASEAGGVEIEEVAARTPDKIVKTAVDPAVGLQPFQTRRLAYGMNVPPRLLKPTADVIASLYQAFVSNDCSLAEINPLAITADGRVLALDAKLNLEDDALFRHPDLKSMRDPEQEDPLEEQASRYDIQYVKLDGDVGCMVNGAGLAMATMDIILRAGAEPANFLDVGGGASEEKVAEAFKIILSDPKVKRILVNIFGGILRCDIAARGIVSGAGGRKSPVPIVMLMRGTNVKEGKAILSKSDLNVTLVNSLREAAQAVQAAPS